MIILDPGLFSFYMEYCKCFNQSPAALMKINQNLRDPAHCTCSEHACMGHRVGGPPRGMPLSALQRTGAGFRSWLELWRKLGGGCANGSCWAEYQSGLTCILLSRLNIRTPTCFLTGYLPAVEGDLVALSGRTQRASMLTGIFLLMQSFCG